MESFFSDSHHWVVAVAVADVDEIDGGSEPFDGEMNELECVRGVIER